MAIQRRVADDGTATYLAKVYIGRGQDGRRREVCKTLPTLKEARGWEAAQKRALAVGTLVEPTQLRLGEYLRQWLAASAGLRARERTVRDYRSLLQTYVLTSGLAEVPLARLTTGVIEAHYARLRSRGIEGGRGPLSDRTLVLVHRVLHAGLERARKGRLIAFNPATDVEFAPRERREMRALTVPEMNKVLEASRGTRWHALWCVLLHGGLRPNEALGLIWPDVLGDGVSVRRALVVGLKDGWKLELPKTRCSVRVLKLPPEAIEALAEHRAKQEIEKIAAGSAYADHGLVFATERGGPANLKNLGRRQWRALLIAADLPTTLRIYDCRHTHASHALAAGVPIPDVAARLGHANPQITLTTYAHALRGHETDAVARIATYVAAASTPA